MIYFLEQKVKSYGVEWGQRVEPCYVHLALRSSTGHILDVLGMACGYSTLQGKHLQRLLCHYTAFKIEFGHKTLTIPHNVLGVNKQC